MEKLQVKIKTTKSRFRVYQIIAVFIFVNTLIVYFDRVNISIVAPIMMKYFEWDMGVMGIVMSMFGAGYIVSQIPGGYLSDKFGGRRVLGWGSFLWSFFTVVTPFCNTPLQMYSARALLGLGEGVNFPAETSVLARWLPRAVRARFQGLNLSGIGMGPLIATPLTVWIMEVWGWQAVFYFFAGLGFLWTFGWLAYSKENPADHRSVSEEELKEIETGQIAEAGTTLETAPMRSGSVWGLAIAYFGFTYTYWVFINWLPTYLVNERGFTTIKMGFLGVSSMVIRICQHEFGRLDFRYYGQKRYADWKGETRFDLCRSAVHGAVPLAYYPGNRCICRGGAINSDHVLQRSQFPVILEFAHGYECKKGWSDSRYDEHRECPGCDSRA